MGMGKRRSGRERSVGAMWRMERRGWGIGLRPAWLPPGAQKLGVSAVKAAAAVEAMQDLLLKATKKIWVTRNSEHRRKRIGWSSHRS